MMNDAHVYRQADWASFTFFLAMVHQYWHSLVYNLDTDSFFTLFSSFLNALQGLFSTFRSSRQFRPPRPPELLFLARTTNKYRRACRRSRTTFKLDRFRACKDIFHIERVGFMQSRRKARVGWLTAENNIWKSARPQFSPCMPPFKGLSTSNGSMTDRNHIVDVLATHYEQHFGPPQHDLGNKAYKRAIEIK